MSLKYLFIATFADGKVIAQTQDDVSETDSKKSRFYDVLQESEKQPLVSFVLEGEGHQFGVDLRDGHFEQDGYLIHIERQDGNDAINPTGKPKGELDLIYFRTNKIHMQVGRAENKIIGKDTVYRFGWKVRGNQNYQRIMQID